MKRILIVGVAASSALLLTVGGLAVASEGGPQQPDRPGPTANASPGEAASLAAVLLSPSSTEDLYVPLRQCRVVSTAAVGGKIGAKAYRSFRVRGTTGFVAQGGKAGGCGVPSYAVAVTVNLSVTGETGNGRLVAYPHGQATPAPSGIAYRKGITLSNGMNLRLSPPGTSPDLRVFNVGAKTHVVIDVTGYVVPQIHAVIAPNGTTYSSSSRILESTRLAAGSYSVRLDRSSAGCTPIASVHGGAFFASSYQAGDYIYAQTFGFSGGAPVAIDLYWSLTVHC